jgi:PilZ domain
MIERRRSSRVRIRIPVHLFSNGAHSEAEGAPAEAIAISRTGALLRAPVSPALGTRIEVRNGHSPEKREFRVIRVSGTGERGLFELGVEILHPGLDFWGIPLPEDYHLVLDTTRSS